MDLAGRATLQGVPLWFSLRCEHWYRAGLFSAEWWFCFRRNVTAYDVLLHIFKGAPAYFYITLKIL
jgi:hypothetical protein